MINLICRGFRASISANTCKAAVSVETSATTCKLEIASSVTFSPKRKMGSGSTNKNSKGRSLIGVLEYLQYLPVLSQLTESVLVSLSKQKALRRNEGTWLAYQKIG
jgi:hypothetical protein